MPRPNKMMDDQKVFYWPDTGPVEYTVSKGQIIQARGVDDGMNCWSWEAGTGNIFDDGHDLKKVNE